MRLALLVLTLAVVPFASGCGGKKAACGSTTCQGCCDAAGECQQGTTPQACGTLGAFCSTCGNAQFCQFGVCVALSGQGGGSGGGGGGGSSTNPGGGAGGGGGTSAGGGAGGGGAATCAQSCEGCCQGTTCMTGNSTSACGGAGQACQTCFPSQVCSDASCWDSSCSGCVSATGCQPGTSPDACGSNGGTCRVCASGASCSEGGCSNPSCNGCQDATGACLPGNSDTSCGLFGTVCAVCGSGRRCVQGQCVHVFPDGGVCKPGEAECSESAQCCSGYCDPSFFFCSSPPSP